MVDHPKPDSSDFAIEVRHLRKEFGVLKAVDGISFELKRGEFLSVFGPNGAGKTTLIKILTGLTRPSSGYLLIRPGRFAPRDRWALAA